MSGKRSLALVFLPTCIWAYAGAKLLFKTIQYIDLLELSFIKASLTIILVGTLTSIKYHYIFKKSIGHQLGLAEQLLKKQISRFTYTKNTILSKKALFIALAASFLLKKYTNTHTLAIIRLAVGYALVRTALSYSLLSKQLLSK